MALLMSPLLAVAIQPQAGLEITDAHFDLVLREARDRAHAIVVVREGRRPYIRTGGVAADGLPFATHAQIPLGEATQVFLQIAVRDAMNEGLFDLSTSLGILVGGLSGDLADQPLGQLKSLGRSCLPHFSNHVRSIEDRRPLADVLATHAFLPQGGRGPVAQGTMLTAAVLQAALESTRRRTWSQILDVTARRVGAGSVQAEAPVHAALSVPRQTVLGQPMPVWRPEVAAAGAATGTASDVAALLAYLLDQPNLTSGVRPGELFAGWRRVRMPPGHGLELEASTPGTSATMRIVPELGYAAWAFTNRAKDQSIRALLGSVHEDRAGDSPGQIAFRSARPRFPSMAANDARGAFEGSIELRRGRLPIRVLGGPRGYEVHVDDPLVESITTVTTGPQLESTIRLRSQTGMRGVFLSLRRAGGKLSGESHERHSLKGAGFTNSLPYQIELLPFSPHPIPLRSDG